MEMQAPLATAAILPAAAANYAWNIYLYGYITFADVPTYYHQAVKEYAARKLTTEPYVDTISEPRTARLDEALASGWISQLEYDETVALIIV